MSGKRGIDFFEDRWTEIIVKIVIYKEWIWLSTIFDNNLSQRNPIHLWQPQGHPF